MFDLAAKRLVWLPVKWKGFASDGDQAGRIVEYDAEIQVELVERDEFQRLFVEPGDDASPEKKQAFDDLLDVDRAKVLAQNWRGIVSNGSAVAFSHDNMAKLMAIAAAFPRAFFQAYANAWQAIPETREGNSDASPAPGPAAGE